MGNNVKQFRVSHKIQPQVPIICLISLDEYISRPKAFSIYSNICNVQYPPGGYSVSIFSHISFDNQWQKHPDIKTELTRHRSFTKKIQVVMIQ